MKRLLQIALVISFASALSNSIANADTERETYKNKESSRSNLNKADDFGLGIKWGTLTGLSGKYWADENQAWELTAGFADSNTAIGLDYLWNFRGAAAQIGKFDGADSLVPFAGFGLLSSFGGNPSGTRIYDHSANDFILGARVPLGIEYLPRTARLGIFGEIGLGLAFVPTSYSFATADLGARYYF